MAGAAFVAPTPDDFKRVVLETMARSDREVLAALRAAQRDVNATLTRLAHNKTFSASIQRAQAQIAKRAIQARMAELWRKIGDITAARRLEAATRVIDLQAQLDAFMLARAGLANADQTAANFAESMARTAESGLDRLHQRVTGGSYNSLSQRVYASSVNLNGPIDTLINSALARGLSARDFASEVSGFINPNTPGGVRYASMRLARTEINNSAHAVAIASVQDHPWVEQMDWHLSGSHPRPDACDALKNGSPYDKGKVPAKPHPQCFCFVTPALPSEDEFLDHLLGGKYNTYLEKFGFQAAEEAAQIAPTVEKAAEAGRAAAKKAARAEAPKGSAVKSARKAGKDQSAWTRANAEDIHAARIAQASTGGDGGLAKLAERQGFDGKPRVVGRAELDQAIENGWTESWRGVHRELAKGTAGQGIDEFAVNQQFRNGKFFPGTGIYGNGTYTSVSRSVAEVYAGRDSGGVVPGGLLRMAIDPKARVVDHDALLVERDTWLKKHAASGSFDDATLINVLSDEGRFATMRGYDIISVKNKGDGSGLFDRATDEFFEQLVVLNRTVVMALREGELV